MEIQRYKYHLVAFLTVAIWGSTFVFTKILLLNGLSPAQIFTLRFAIAYVLMVAGHLMSRQPFKLFANSWLDELLMVLLGITGGSVYFLMENAAMLAVTDHLPEGCTTVGGHIASSHLKPSRLGDTVTATATVTGVDGKKIEFKVQAHCGDVLLGEGTHLRFIVDRNKFMSRL